MYDLLVLGGGAAGLMAAALAAKQTQAAQPARVTKSASGGSGGSVPQPSAPLRVAILEKESRVGKKLLATGNGTCNLSNIAAAPERYHGGRDFADAVLSCVSVDDVRAFFHGIGLETVAREDGRIYPLCGHAGAVLDCLRMVGKAEEKTDCTAESICPIDGGFAVRTSQGEFQSRFVLACTGGAASASADGYPLLTALGHRVTPLHAAVVPVSTDKTYVKAMSGMRVDARVTCLLDGHTLQSECGEVLFTDYGVSGPAVLQLSRHAGAWEQDRRGNLTLELDLLPDMTEQDLRAHLEFRLSLNRMGEDFLTGLFHRRIGQTLVRAAGGRLAEPVKDIDALCRVIRHFPLPVTGTKGLPHAQVTAGGVDTAEVEAATMESKLIQGLYLAGEVLDVDGDCGGFNLHFAWCTAILAMADIRRRLGR
ncbi:MAG: aminoacetone oxidase family FAD-binding enzyme [Oscillospiraceae bacterium]|nr:aminoacetone oxidase family FAD-binding enzyme [Oscillospiraceae bacterium]